MPLFFQDTEMDKKVNINENETQYHIFTYIGLNCQTGRV